jgi:hypothetical protein
LAFTASLTKLAERPMTVSREMACMTRMAKKAVPRAPALGGPARIWAREAGVMSESRGREEIFAVRRGKCFVWKGTDAGDDAREEEILGEVELAFKERRVECWDNEGVNDGQDTVFYRRQENEVNGLGGTLADG